MALSRLGGPFISATRLRVLACDFSNSFKYCCISATLLLRLRVPFEALPKASFGRVGVLLAVGDGGAAPAPDGDDTSIAVTLEYDML